MNCGGYESSSGFALLALALGIFVTPMSEASAAELALARDRTLFVTVQGGKFAGTHFPSIREVITNEAQYRDAYILSASLNFVVWNDFSLPLFWPDHKLNGNSIEVEANFSTHFGQEDHDEAVLGLVYRTGDFPVTSNTSFNLAAVNGISYAFQRPKLEKGPSRQFGVGSPHVQYYIGLETEWTIGRDSPLHFVGGIHHRSGVFGLLSPQKSSSNYLEAGIRLDLN